MISASENGVTELDAFAPQRPGEVPRLEAWLRTLREQGGSDLYLVAGSPPAVRVRGGVRALPEPVLDGDEIEETVLPALPTHAAAKYRHAPMDGRSVRVVPTCAFEKATGPS